MKKRPPVALIISGPVDRTSVTALPGLADRLGPVKAPSLRVARRFANTLKAGVAVRDYEGLAEARVILVCVPDRELNSVIHSLEFSRLNWKHRAVILVDSPLESSTLNSLAARGAFTASLNGVPDMAGTWVVEGHQDAVRDAQALGRSRTTRVLALNPGTKPLYLASLAFSNPLFLPLVSAATDTLRGTGLPLKDVRDIAQHLFHHSLSVWFKVGKRRWGQSDVQALTQSFQSFDKDNPMLGYLYDRMSSGSGEDVQ